MYWLKWRYRSPKFNLLWLGLATLLTLAVAAFYSTIRHGTLATRGATERSFSTIAERLKETSLDDTIVQVSRDWMHYLAQYTTHYSLLTIHLVDSGEAPVEPLNTLAFLVTYPIPRILFPAKPALFSGRIVSEVLHLPYLTNWGLGIAGHGYQEGGYLVIVLYGFLCVVLVRLMDDAMQRRPDNVFLLAIMSAAAPHVLSMTRGDTGIMSAEIAEAFAFAWIVGLTCRFIFGTESSNSRTASLGPPYEPLDGQVYHAKR
jgi:hypothetical protein